VYVRHAEPADARGLIGQGLFVGMEAEVDNVAYAGGMDVGQLRFGWLTGRGDPIIKASPIVDRPRIGH